MAMTIDQETLRKLAQSLGLKAVEALTSQLDMDQLLQRGEEVLRSEIRETLSDLFQDTESALSQELIGTLYENLDEDKVVAATAPPLAAELAPWFENEGLDNLVDAIIERLDLEELSDKVAGRIAQRVKIEPGG